MKESELWQFLLEKAQSGTGAALLTVAESHNSSPGKAGFKMAVAADGSLFGTVGGGIMEYNLIQEALSLIDSGVTYSVKRLQHSKSTPLTPSGLNCGGTQTILTFSITNDQIPLLCHLTQCCATFVKCTLSLSSSGMEVLNGEQIVCGRSFVFNSVEDFIYKETVAYPYIAYVIGGGHVGLAVCRALVLLDFYIVSIDPRSDVFTMRQNNAADRKLHVPYAEIDSHITDGERSYVVIVTADKESDTLALRQVIRKKLAYLGMMGSKTKSRSIFQELAAEGFEPELFNRVHTPIGLELNAETPAEIAASIVAEIITRKNEVR